MPANPTTHPHLGAWIELTPAFSWRDGAASGATVAIAGGARSGALDVGLELGWQGPRLLDAVSNLGTFTAVDAAIVARWTPARSLAPRFGLEAGGSLRSFRDGASVLESLAVPFAGLEAGIGVQLGAALVLAPEATTRCDLATITVERGEDAPTALGGCELGGGVAFIGIWR